MRFKAVISETWRHNVTVEAGDRNEAMRKLLGQDCECVDAVQTGFEIQALDPCEDAESLRNDAPAAQSVEP